MTVPAPPVRVPTPRGKASSTAAAVTATATASSSSTTKPLPPAPPSAAAAAARRSHGRTASTAPSSLDFLSDQATKQLIRRVLCPSQQLSGGGDHRGTPAPIEELLPPLTSRNDVDLQLYAFLAIVLRESVQNWYAKITPDETFVDEIVRIIAHCTRAIEQRLRKVDVESLLFDELPDLLDRHVSGELAYPYALLTSLSLGSSILPRRPCPAAIAAVDTPRLETGMGNPLGSVT